MGLSTSIHEIKTLVLSSHPIIAIETVEEERVLCSRLHGRHHRPEQSRPGNGADGVVHHDDLDIVRRRLEREPHRVLARASAGHHGERHPAREGRQDPPRAGDVRAGRGDHHRAHRGMGREVTDGRRQDRHRAEAQELLRRPAAEARAEAAGRNDGRHARHRDRPGRARARPRASA